MAIMIQIRKKGALTLPVEIRTRYDLDEGDSPEDLLESPDQERESLCRERYAKD